MLSYFAQWNIDTTPFLELFELIISIIFENWLVSFFEVLIFDVLLGIFNNMFLAQTYGLDNPLAFGFFLICLATAAGVLWYNAR